LENHRSVGSQIIIHQWLFILGRFIDNAAL
jgi:hypothetical protein